MKDDSEDIGTHARAHGARAIDILNEVMEGAVEDKDRIRAAEAILDRGYGKPSQAIIAIPASRRMQSLLAAYSDDQLVAVIEKKELPRLTGPKPQPVAQTISPVAHSPRSNTPSMGHGPAADAYAEEIDPLLL